MSKKPTTTRTKGKAPLAGQGAQAPKPSTIPTKDDTAGRKEDIDPDKTVDGNSPLEPPVQGGTGDKDDDSTIKDTNAGAGAGSGDTMEPPIQGIPGDNNDGTAGEPLAPKPVVIPVIAAAYDGTAELVRRLWEKFLPEGVPVIVLSAGATEQRLVEFIADESVPDEFIFVPANCVPVAPVDLADLAQIKVYVRKDGTRSFNARLPMLLSKDRLVESLAAESGSEPDNFFERYVKTHHHGIRPMEVSHDFGNFVTVVMRSNPCENTVIGGMCQRKFIAATAEGWRAIEHLLTKRLE